MIIINKIAFLVLFLSLSLGLIVVLFENNFQLKSFSFLILFAIVISVLIFIKELRKPNTKK